MAQRDRKPWGCAACMYYDVCTDKPMKTAKCEYFDPDDDAYMDRWVKRVTDAERAEYREAFREYVRQYSDEYTER